MNLQGLLIKSVSGFYYVEADNVVYECKARGIFRKNDEKPVVGDHVEIDVNNDKGIIEKIFQRKNLIFRPLVSNVDKLFIVSSYCVPEPNALNIDRLTVIAESLSIEPIVVFNKSDLGSLVKWQKIYSDSGIKCFIVSASTGEGTDLLANELDGCVCAFSGNSGVGKSSLLNRLFPDINLQTGEVSTKLGRGRHTTRHIEMIRHDHNGYVADTPGFSSLDTDNYGNLLKDDLQYNFIEFKGYLGKCKFTSCHHIGEKGCSICEAVDKGFINKSRYNSYLLMYNELKDKNIWDKKV